MKFTTETSKLKEALQRLGFGVNKKSVLPVLGNILVTVLKGEILLITTDLMVTIHFKIECETEGEGQFLVPFEHLKNIIALESGDVTIEWLSLEKGARAVFADDVFVLGNHGVVSDFPKIPSIPSKGLIELNADFISALNTATISAGKDEERPAMMNLCVELGDNEVKVISTDARIMYVHTLKTEIKAEHKQLLVPVVVAKVVDGFSSIKVGFTKNMVSFDCGSVVITAKLGEGTYPAWQQIMPQHMGNMKLELNQVKEAVGKAFVMSDATNNGIDFMIEPQQLELKTDVEDTGMACSLKIPVESQSPVEHIRFNGRILKLMIQQLEQNVQDNSSITFGLTAPNKAITAMLEENENVIILLMPINIATK